MRLPAGSLSRQIAVLLVGACAFWFAAAGSRLPTFGPASVPAAPPLAAPNALPLPAVAPAVPAAAALTAAGAPVDAPAAVEAISEPVQTDVESPAFWRPVDRLRIARIGLDVEVTHSPFVVQNGSGSWAIPAFLPGHAEHTGGAGAAGNAVLFGHVTHPTDGSIFKDVHLLRVGDPLGVQSGDVAFQYVVAEVIRVSRTDVWVLEPTDEPMLSLVTCTGQWLPQLQDFAERLIVRAVLQ